jgi:hypothetical protein
VRIRRVGVDHVTGFHANVGLEDVPVEGVVRPDHAPATLTLCDAPTVAVRTFVRDENGTLETDTWLPQRVSKTVAMVESGKR